jgi:hypothetical protein
MKHREISPAEQLDAKLAIRSMRRHEHLWRIAEGRMRWVEGLGLLLALLLVAVGLLQMFREPGFSELMRSSQGLGTVVIGVALLGSFLWGQTQRQLNALLELVKRLELERSKP